MTREQMEKLTNTMQEKIGQDASSLIADDIALLITDSEKTEKELENKDTEINNFKERNNKLMEVNANLFQQISVGKEETINKNEDDKKKKNKISLKDAFDEKGNFKN